MQRIRHNNTVEFDTLGDQARGPYDPPPADDADLWFLPTDPQEEPDFLPSGPRADRQSLFDPAEWRAAQDGLSGELAGLAVTFGALDERLRAAGPERAKGLHQRLALLEVADLGWWTGDRIGTERLALWTGLRLGALGEDAQALARAGWAVRRLGGGPPPDASGWATGLTTFLGRSAPGGDGIPEAISELAEVMEANADLHPVTRSAILFHAWRMLSSEVPVQGPAQDVEAAVLAARHGAAMARQGGRGALFLPLTLSGPAALRATGPAAKRLAAWIAGATQATLAALLHLDRIESWRARARAATCDLSGRTPARLIDCLAIWPVVSAPLAEAQTDASRAAVQRNIERLSERNLIREITGQGRYRVWTTAP